MNTTTPLTRLSLCTMLCVCSIASYAGTQHKGSDAKGTEVVSIGMKTLEQSDVNSAAGQHPRSIQTATGGDFVISAGTHMALTPGVALSLGGNFSNSGAFTAGTPTTIVFNGTGDQTLSGETSFDNLLKLGGGVLALSNSIIVNNSLIVVNGSINTGTDSISFGPNGTLDGNIAGGSVIGPGSVVRPGALALSLFEINGWNMVSVPVRGNDYSKRTLYPTATSNAFAFHSGYVPRDSLSIGEGFWMKFDGTQNVGMIGGTIVQDTISVEAGWNMIGSISTSIAASSIVSIPGGVGTSAFFGYDGGYTVSDFIDPGRAYWVRMDQACQLVLSSSLALAASNRIRIVPGSEQPPPPPQRGATDGVKDLPKDFVLSQNYPNPFNPTSTIRYALPLDAHVSLKVYNTLGQVVSVLVDGLQVAGYKSVVWDASNVASGVYFCRLEATSLANPAKAFTQVRKMMLMK